MYAARVGSALKISAGKLPFLGTLSYFKLLIAVTISNFDGLSALISKSVFSSGTQYVWSVVRVWGVQYPLKVFFPSLIFFFFRCHHCALLNSYWHTCISFMSAQFFLSNKHQSSSAYMLLHTAAKYSSVCHIVNDVFTVTFCGIFFLYFFLDGDACGEGVCNSFDLVRNRNKI